MAQEFRLVTGAGEHAARCFRMGIRTGTEMQRPEDLANYLSAFEDLQCDHGPYAIPEEKVVASLSSKLLAGMQTRWAHGCRNS